MPIIGRTWASSTRIASRSMVRVVVVMTGCSFRSVLEAEGFVDEDDRDAPRDDLAVDDQDLVDAAVNAVRLQGAGVLEREGVLLDALEALVEIGDDLLAADDEGDPPRAGDIWTQLAPAHR